MKMKAIEWIWNLIFYNMYKWEVKLYRILDYVDPFYWLNKTTRFKEHRSKYGVDDMNKLKENIMTNPNAGFGLYPVYASIGGLFVLFELVFLNISLLLVNCPLSNILENTSTKIVVFGLIILLAILFNQVTLYRNNKYLDYFEKFNTLADRRKSFYGLLCLFVIVVIIGSFFATLSLLS